MQGRSSFVALPSSTRPTAGLRSRLGCHLLLVGLGASLMGCPRPSAPPPTSDGGLANDGADPPPTQPPPDADRTPAVPDDHPMFGRFEGAGFPNDCQTDAACHIGGCSSEVCSADEGVITTCDVPLVSLPASTQCGCVGGQCRWWNESGQTLPLPPAPPAVDCDGTPCAPPRECIEYFGIAGANGPKFYSCDIRCLPGKPGCPEGTVCQTIADGPGSVCR